MTTREAATVAGLHVSTIYQAIDRGRLSCSLYSPLRRWPEKRGCEHRVRIEIALDDLSAWLASDDRQMGLRLLMGKR